MWLVEPEFQIILGVDKRILLWNIADGVPVIDLTGHTEAVFALSFSRDGHVLASGNINSVSTCLRVKLYPRAHSLF